LLLGNSLTLSLGKEIRSQAEPQSIEVGKNPNRIGKNIRKFLNQFIIIFIMVSILRWRTWTKFRRRDSSKYF